MKLFIILGVILVLAGIGYAVSSGLINLSAFGTHPTAMEEAKDHTSSSFVPPADPETPYFNTAEKFLTITPFSNKTLGLIVSDYTWGSGIAPYPDRIEFDWYSGDVYYVYDSGNTEPLLRVHYYSPGVSMEENLYGVRDDDGSGEHYGSEMDETEFRKICKLHTWEANGTTYYQLGYDEATWRSYLTNKYLVSRGEKFIGAYCGLFPYVLIDNVLIGDYPPTGDPLRIEVVPGSVRLIEG